MAWTYEIYDPLTATTYDITNRTLELRATEKLDAETNEFKVICKNINLVHKFHTMTVKKDGVIKYAGYIIIQEDSDKGYKLTQFSCFDWTYIFSNRIVAETYESTDGFAGRPDLIIKDMIATAAPELTVTNVDVCDVTAIEYLQFPYVQLMEAIAKVTDYIPGWHFYVDAEKDVHLFNNYESDGVTFGPDGNGNYNFSIKSLKVQYIGDRQVNKLWIIGAKQAQAAYIEQFYTGDGEQRYFSLAYEPNFTEIYLDGVLKDSLLESNDDGAQDFLINKQQKVFFIPNNIVTPFTGTIKARYRPTKQVIDFFENPTSIATYGLYEKVVKNKDITDKLSARQFGKAEIRRKAAQKRIVQLTTREQVSIGQRCELDIVADTWNIAGYFVVLSVDTSVTLADEVRSVTLEEIVL